MVRDTEAPFRNGFRNHRYHQRLSRVRSRCRGLTHARLQSCYRAPVNVGAPDAYFYTSDYYRVYAVQELKPLITGTVVLSDELYYDDEAFVTAER